MRAVFRVDASFVIGSGHVMRCLTLADSLRARGVDVHFITRDHPGNLRDAIEARGFSCHALPPTSSRATPDLHLSWLGCGWQEDAALTASVVKRLGYVDWIAIDHYAIDAHWEQAMRDHARRIMVIDDLADRPHCCDLLLDQNVMDPRRSRYGELVPPDCILLLGPTYALLRPQFALERNIEKRDIEGGQRLLVFFGGVDATDETGKFLDAWREYRPAGYAADVLVGIANPRRDDIERRASQLEGVCILGHVGDMASLMARSVYSFGASGSTVWERFCVGLDSCITSVAHNQRELAQQLAELGLVDFAGDWQETDARVYAALLVALESKPAERVRRRHRIMQVVDGRGTDRVAARLCDDNGDIHVA